MACGEYSVPMMLRRAGFALMMIGINGDWSFKLPVILNYMEEFMQELTEEVYSTETLCNKEYENWEQPPYTIW